MTTTNTKMTAEHNMQMSDPHQISPLCKFDLLSLHCHFSCRIWDLENIFYKNNGFIYFISVSILPPYIFFSSLHSSFLFHSYIPLCLAPLLHFEDIQDWEWVSLEPIKILGWYSYEKDWILLFVSLLFSCSCSMPLKYFI